MNKTKSQTVIITGASKRIGREIAISLARAGWNIALHFNHSAEDANNLGNEIKAMGAQYTLIQADLEKAPEVESIIRSAANRFGSIDALINNASLFERDTASTFTTESWDAHLNVNLRAPALLMRDFAQQAKPGANIINIIDQRVWRLTPDFTSYTVSKAGLWALTQTYAQALAPQQIRVNAIGPGPTLPNPRQTQENFDLQASLVPLTHGATPEDIMNGVSYILNARAMTGQMIALDGGQHLAWQTPDVTEVKE